ncbi:hypothetical protein KTQ89_06570 [Holdemanella porci]|uniref:hypothetical protein n=1 Tax=Holdemanella porci TaxID=2652276 RepID=UPI001C2C0856|nr:hypothetical protein [Holdemanella porci]MBU9872024.1 hypothetical protein [Holdemanella porci]
MVQVNYKKVLQSKKNINKKNVVPFQPSKRVPIINVNVSKSVQDKNQLSSGKVKQTQIDVTNNKSKDETKKKKMSLLEGTIATKMTIEKYIKMSGVYKWTGLNLGERKNKLIHDINKLHSEEHMIDDKYIYPRGIDYVQKVILFTHRRVQYLKLTGAGIKKEYEQMDLVWTLQWIERFKYSENIEPFIIENKDNEYLIITCKDFFSLCNKKSKEFYKIKNKNGELFGFKQKKERVLTYKECAFILKKYWLKSYIQILSVLIGEVEIELLHCEYEFIKYEKKIINRTLNIKQLSNDKNLINICTLNLKQNRLSKLKKYIYKNHPCQKEIVYDSDTNSYYITRDMYQWYKQIYCSSTTDYELFQKDFQYYKEYIRGKNIYLQNNLIAIDNYKSIKKIWRLTEIEYECYLSLFEYKYEKKILTSYEYEEVFKELMLRHIIFIKNEHEKKISSQSKKRKTLYTKIESLTYFGIYDGYVENLKAINNHIEIYVHTSYSENLEFIKINLNLDSIKQEAKKMLMQFLAKGVSIRFEVMQDKKSEAGVLESFTIRQVLQFDREVKNGKLEYRCII